MQDSGRTVASKGIRTCVGANATTTIKGFTLPMNNVNLLYTAICAVVSSGFPSLYYIRYVHIVSYSSPPDGPTSKKEGEV